MFIGPIENISSNTGEIVRVFSCSKILAVNLTRTRFDLLTKPFRKTLVHMKDDVKEVQNAFNELRDVTKALHEEVMGDLVNNTLPNRNKRYGQHYKADYIEDKYKNKFRKRCLQQLDSGKARCLKAFANSLDKCHQNMPFIIKTLICWPFKVDLICNINILGDPEKICNPSDAIPSNFGKTYVDLVETENKLYQESSNVKVNYTIMSPDNIPGIR